MALRGPGVVKCFGCGMTYDTVAEYVSHGCEGGVVGVGWLAPRDAPAEETRLERERFLAALPDRALPGGGEESGGDDDPGGEGGEELGERVVRYVEEHPEESAVAIAGRFGLSPAAAEEIESVRA
jgi:hypothetical protein